MSDEDTLNYLRSKIQNEGFDYCFRHYSKWDEIDDPEFQIKLANYIKAAGRLERCIQHMGEEDEDCIDYKFDCEEEYLQWCSDIVNRIYISQVCCNTENITEAMQQISSRLHMPEGWEMYK